MREDSSDIAQNNTQRTRDLHEVEYDNSTALLNSILGVSKPPGDLEMSGGAGGDRTGGLSKS